ncbi:peroxiredoxin family protein [Candidatus Margulisiibacteriota bacterium]
MLRKAIVIFVVALLAAPALARPDLNIGSLAPSFILPDLDGNSVYLDRYLGSNVVVLSFFASWSKSCQQEMAFLKELDEEYRNKGIKVIGVSYDRKLESLKQYVEENKLLFTVLHDKKLKTLKDYRILIIPTLFVIDLEGNITNIYVDFDENVAEAVSKDIQKLLAPSKK